jgi:hypothetical protein
MHFAGYHLKRAAIQQKGTVAQGKCMRFCLSKRLRKQAKDKSSGDKKMEDTFCHTIVFACVMPATEQAGCKVQKFMVGEFFLAAKLPALRA